jgi:1-acyl-sn-glycerol-3-phosphate acyltransferase
MRLMGPPSRRVVTGRWLHLVWHIIVRGGVQSARMPRMAAGPRNALKQDWSRRLLETLGVEVTIEGEVPTAGSALVVANHVSWLDIHVIDAVLPTRFVAKSEIRRWPVAGGLAARAGTIFIDRKRRRDTGRTAGVVVEALRAGDVVGVFPEGTTTTGEDVLKFHASLLQPAVDAGATCVPVAIRYLDQQGNRCKVAAYVGETSLIESLGAIVKTHGLRVHVTFLEPITPSGQHRRELANELQARIATVIRAG